MTKTSFIVTCQDNPNIVFGVAESRKGAEAIVNECVDAAQDVLSIAHYEHLVEKGLSADAQLDTSDYSSEGEVSQASPDNYVISEVLVGQPTEVNVLPAPAPVDEEDEEDEDENPDFFVFEEDEDDQEEEG